MLTDKQVLDNLKAQRAERIKEINAGGPGVNTARACLNTINKAIAKYEKKVIPTY